MATFFKASCSVFWLVWMATLSFHFGVMQTEDKYTFLNEHDPLGIMMMAACITIILMAFLGCFCIKCDITHICCAIWYIIPTIVGTLGLCGFMLFLLRSPDGGANLDEGDVLQLVIDEWRKKKQIPGFLQFTQAHSSCCGIFGFKDYRAFVLPASVKQEVPFSCCQDLDSGLQDMCTPYELDSLNGTTLENVFEDRTIPGKTLPIPLPLLPNGKINDPQLAKYAASLYGSKNKAKDEWDNPADPNLWLPVNQTKATRINHQGCFSELKKSSDTVVTAYFAFSLFLMACALLMTILYIQNCLKARRLHHESIQDLMLEGAVKGHPHNNSMQVDEDDTKKILQGLSQTKKTPNAIQRPKD